jgi:hypothetical protein
MWKKEKGNFKHFHWNGMVKIKFSPLQALEALRVVRG